MARRKSRTSRVSRRGKRSRTSRVQRRGKRARTSRVSRRGKRSRTSRVSRRGKRSRTSRVSRRGNLSGGSFTALRERRGEGKSFLSKALISEFNFVDQSLYPGQTAAERIADIIYPMIVEAGAEAEVVQGVIAGMIIDAIKGEQGRADTAAKRTFVSRINEAALAREPYKHISFNMDGSSLSMTYKRYDTRDNKGTTVKRDL